MILKYLILVAILVQGTWAACQCYQPSMFTGIKAPVNSAFDTVTYDACYSSACGFVAYSGSESKGWKNITIKFSTLILNDPTGAIDIYDGTTNTNFLKRVNLKDISSTLETVDIISPSPRIFIQYTQDDTTKPNTYYGFAIADGALATTPLPTTTGIPTTTRTYNASSGFSRDPYLIAHDLMIIVSQRSAALPNLNALATNLVNQLSVTTDINSETGTRLGLTTLTPYPPYTSPQGQIWTMSQTDVINALPKSGITATINYSTALLNILDFFKVVDDVSPTRKNAQRTVVMFTGDWPTTSDGDLTVLQDKYMKRGVNLLIVSYNLNSGANLNAQSWYNYKNVAATNDAAVASFVNPFFFNDKSAPNNWCKGVSSTTDSSTLPVTWTSSDYSGPSGTDTWPAASDGQANRYCNFQDFGFTYNGPAPATLSVTVFYELEIEKDYLRFYADGIEIESFTGQDVNAAQFNVQNVTTLYAKFTTDNKSVYRGFSATINAASP